LSNNNVIVSPEQTTVVFSLLCKMVAHVSNPSDCSSAERCVLAHLYDLYSNCSLLKTKPHSSEGFNNANPKIRAAYYTALTLTPSNHLYNSQFMVDILNSPRRGGKIEPQWARQLNEAPANRYRLTIIRPFRNHHTPYPPPHTQSLPHRSPRPASPFARKIYNLISLSPVYCSFVCNAIVAVCSETDNDKLNDIAITCAELTACCNALNTEWLGVLSALCCSSNSSANYIDVQNQVDVQDLSIHNSLAVFTSILIGKLSSNVIIGRSHTFMIMMFQNC
jgi:mediator of RNA polymerase II transcription subunit 12